MEIPRIITLRPSECWWKIDCHFCFAPNWILDDQLIAVEEDYTYGVQCWKCDKAFWFDSYQTDVNRCIDIYNTLGAPSIRHTQIVSGYARPRKPRKPDLKNRKDLQEPT